MKKQKKESKKYRYDISGIINIDIVAPIKRRSNPHNIHSMNQHQENLAYELAETLDDTHSMKFYFSAVEKYSEAFLRDKLAKVLAKKDIRTSKGQFFNYLVNNEHAAKNYPRN